MTGFTLNRRYLLAFLATLLPLTGLFDAAVAHAACGDGVSVGYSVTKVSGPGGDDKWVFQFKVVNEGDKPVKAFETTCSQCVPGSDDFTRPHGWNTLRVVDDNDQTRGAIWYANDGQAVQPGSVATGYMWTVEHPGPDPPVPDAVSILWCEPDGSNYTILKKDIEQNHSKNCEPPEDHGYQRSGSGFGAWWDVIPDIWLNFMDCCLAAGDAIEPSTQPFVTDLVSPPLDFTEESEPSIGFRHLFQSEGEGFAEFAWSVDGGFSWSPLMELGLGCMPGLPCVSEGRIRFDVPQLGGLADVLFRWRFAWEGGPGKRQGFATWVIDDIVVLGDELVPATGTPPGLGPDVLHVWPNPFAQSTRISYSLPRPGSMELAVYDLRGRRVFVLRSGDRPAGEQFLEWDGRDVEGKRLPAGVYFLQLRQGDRSWSRKIAVLE